MNGEPSSLCGECLTLQREALLKAASDPTIDFLNGKGVDVRNEVINSIRASFDGMGEDAIRSCDTLQNVRVRKELKAEETEMHTKDLVMRMLLSPLNNLFPPPRPGWFFAVLQGTISRFIEKIEQENKKKFKTSELINQLWAIKEDHITHSRDKTQITEWETYDVDSRTLEARNKLLNDWLVPYLERNRGEKRNLLQKTVEEKSKEEGKEMPMPFQELWRMVFKPGRNLAADREGAAERQTFHDPNEKQIPPSLERCFKHKQAIATVLIVARGRKICGGNAEPARQLIQEASPKMEKISDTIYGKRKKAAAEDMRQDEVRTDYFTRTMGDPLAPLFESKDKRLLHKNFFEALQKGLGDIFGERGSKLNNRLLEIRNTRYFSQETGVDSRRFYVDEERTELSRVFIGELLRRVEGSRGDRFVQRLVRTIGRPEDRWPLRWKQILSALKRYSEKRKGIEKLEDDLFSRILAHRFRSVIEPKNDEIFAAFGKAINSGHHFLKATLSPKREVQENLAEKFIYELEVGETSRSNRIKVKQWSEIYKAESLESINKEILRLFEFVLVDKTPQEEGKDAFTVEEKFVNDMWAHLEGKIRMRKEEFQKLWEEKMKPILFENME